MKPVHTATNGNIKYRLKRCLSTSCRLPKAIPALQTPPKSSSALFPSKWRGIRKSIGHGRYTKSLRMTERAMMSAWPTSDPFIPARMFILFVAKVESRDI